MVWSTMPSNGEGKQTQKHISHRNKLSSDLLAGSTLRSLLLEKQAGGGIDTYSCYSVSRKVCTLCALGSELRLCQLIRSSQSRSPERGTPR